MLKFVLPLITVALTSAQSCVAVPKDKCGTKWDDNCLKCGDKSSFDCELCCPGCHTVSKGEYKYCECGKGPSPAPSPSPSPSKKGCVAVPKDKCGTDYFDSCLKCGDKSAFDCELCCPNCKLVSKGEDKFCECGKGPSPGPGPGPSPDSWREYHVGGMDVLSVTGGKNASAYDKVVIMLHGGGGSGSDWRYQYNAGWFGDLAGLKYVFPTSPNHLWYISFKNGCGLIGDCAYNISSIHESASRVSALIQHESRLLGGDHSKVYLAGFSEGAQLTSYMQIAKLDFALGGVIVMDGFPLPPLCDMPQGPAHAAKRNASYYGDDMNWMIWHGANDPIFPAKLTMDSYHSIFDILGARGTLHVDHTEPGQSHTLIQSEFERMVAFIRG